jgi:hypothetical protein
LIRELARDTDLWDDPVWITDSTPVECARSRPTTRRSNLAGWAGYSYCPSHSRWFSGLRLHLICTPAGLPLTWALADPKIDERQVLMAVLDQDPTLIADRDKLTIIGDKGYISAELDRYLHERGIVLLRPSYRSRTPQPGQHLLAPIRQLIESVNDTLQGQLCAASSSWQDFGLGKVGDQRVGLGDVDVVGPVPGQGLVGADGVVFDPVALRVHGQVEDVVDLFEEQPFVLQRPEAALAGAVLTG